jgi:methylmalonyl-CoA/ethylmalonyl-CoA epimerase
MYEIVLKPLHVGLSVADMQESIDWYHNILGFELLSRKKMEFLKCEVAFMKKGNFQIELFRHDDTICLPADRREPNKDIQTQGTKHICYEVEDVSKLLEELRAKGVDIVMGPNKMEETLMGFIHDNTGNLIEFIQPHI